jgi:hypothetical protein
MFSAPIVSTIVILLARHIISANDVWNAQQKLDNIHAANGGCAIDEIPYYVDGDASKPACGKCIPGTSGAEDTSKMCDINEFCSDDAKCVHLRNHPLYGAPCPYELGGKTSFGLCGPGLRCFMKKCLPCWDGMVDYSDGKKCYNNLWTVSDWDSVFFQPAPTILISLMGIVVIYIMFEKTIECAICLGCCCMKRIRKKSNKEESSDGESDSEED